MAKRKQPSGRGFDLAFDAIQKQREVVYRKRCDRAQRLGAIIETLRPDIFYVTGEVITFDFENHKFQIREIDEG